MQGTAGEWRTTMSRWTALHLALSLACTRFKRCGFVFKTEFKMMKIRNLSLVIGAQVSPLAMSNLLGEK